MDIFIYWIGMAGIVAFAITAVLALAPREIDFISAIVLGIITAIGGGSIRDVILNTPVFWSIDANYLWIAIAASIVAFRAHLLLSRKEIFRLMLYVDGLGAALFAIQSVDKVWALGFGLPLAPILLGTVTAIGGGIIRDVLVGHQTLLVNRELYITPVSLGCTLYVCLLYFTPEYRLLSTIGCCLFIFGTRSAAIYWDLSVPDWLTTKRTFRER